MPDVHVKVAGAPPTVHNLPDKPGGFTVIVHGQGMGITVPTFVEVNSRTTLRCMEDMTQKEWEWISQGELFRTLWGESFDFSNMHNAVPKTPPSALSELLAGDAGVIHVAGMIVQGCETFFANKNLFLKNPEDLLHPATERYIMGMFQTMLKLCGHSGVVTKEEQNPEHTEAPTVKKKKGKSKAEEPKPLITPEQAAEEDFIMNSSQTLTWLSKFPPDRAVISIGQGGPKLTAAELISEIENKTELGAQVVALFVQKRDGA